MDKKENGQLPSVAVLGQGQNSGDYLVFTLMKYPRPAYRNFTNQFLSPTLLPNWFPIVSIDNCQEDRERFLPFSFLWCQERLWWRGERRMKGQTNGRFTESLGLPPGVPPSPALCYCIPGVATPTRGNWLLNDMRDIRDMTHSEFSSSFGVLQCSPWQPPSFSLPTCLAYLKVFWPLSDIKLV